MPITSPSLSIISQMESFFRGGMVGLHALFTATSAASGAAMLLGLAIVIVGLLGLPIHLGFPREEMLGPRRFPLVRNGLGMFWYGMLVMHVGLALSVASGPTAAPFAVASYLASTAGILMVLKAERMYRIDGDTIGFPRWPEPSRIAARYAPHGVRVRTIGFALWGLGAAASFLWEKASM
jgi:hypothetical protein